MTQDFKVGDKVRCIKPYFGHLTQGRVYTVKGLNGISGVRLIDDTGDDYLYSRERFELAEPAFDPTTNEKAWHFLTEEERKVFKEWEHGLLYLTTEGEWRKYFMMDSYAVDSNRITRAKPAPKVKEMTVAEIEEALGYQVKVVK